MNRGCSAIFNERRSLFLDGGNNDLRTLGAGSIEQQKREAAVTGDQAKFLNRWHLDSLKYFQKGHLIEDGRILLQRYLLTTNTYYQQ